MNGEYLAGIRTKMDDAVTLARGALISRTGIDMGIVYGGKVLEAVVGLASNVIVARVLGPEKLGVLMLVITFSGILTVVMGFGLDHTSVKFIADSRKSGTWPVQTVVRTALQLRLLFIFMGSLAALLLCRRIASTVYRAPDMEYLLMFGVVVAGANSLFLLFQAFLRGFERFLKMVASNTAGRILRLVIIISIFVYSNMSVENVLWANVVAALIIVAVDMYFIKREGVSIIEWKKMNRTGIAGNMMGYSAWLWVSGIIFVMNESLNILMLGNLMTVASVGFYSVANNLIRPFEYFPETINQVMLPKMSGIRDYDHFMKISRKIILVGLVICISLIPILIFAKPIVQLLYGTRYENAGIILQFLVLSMGLSIVLNPLMMLSHRLNVPYLFTLSSVISLFVGVVMNLLLIPKYGEVGCAITYFFVVLSNGLFVIPKIFKKAREMDL